MTYVSRPETQKHIDEVRFLLIEMSAFLIERSVHHDTSKKEPPELDIFNKYTPKLRNTTYGSAEYKHYLTEMRSALDHHYAHNRHHPEHHPQGIDGMDLVDLVEMFCDWLAATKRHADGDIVKSIEINSERFGISPQLVHILLNTAAFFKERA